MKYAALFTTAALVFLQQGCNKSANCKGGTVLLRLSCDETLADANSFGVSISEEGRSPQAGEPLRNVTCPGAYNYEIRVANYSAGRTLAVAITPMRDDKPLGAATAASISLSAECVARSLALGFGAGMTSDGGAGVLDAKAPKDSPTNLNPSDAATSPGADAGIVCTEGVGARRCRGADFSVEECTATGWSTQMQCPNICAGGTCVGICRPGRDARCAADGKTREVCSADAKTFEVAEVCPFACGMGGVCVACAPNTRQCMGNQPQTCGSAGWANDGPPCANGCDTATGLCKDCPTAGEKKCSGKTILTCGSDGQWKPGSMCPAGQGCIAGACTPCDPASSQMNCAGDVLQACSAAGAWQTMKDCATQNVSCVGGACGECKVGARTCNQKAPVVCGADARWSEQPACGVYCSPADGMCKTCVPGTVRCSANGQGVETCAADGSAWALTKGCAPFLCAGGQCKTTCGSAAECVGAKCIGNVCGGTLGNGQSCTANDECTSGACAPEGVCCNEKCDGVCKSCGTGTCGDVVGDDPGLCSGTKTCSAGCKLKDKQPCAADGDCALGACRTYYRDGDADGFGRVQGDKFCGTSPPDASYLVAGGDCCDMDALVKPTQVNYFLTVSACGDFNYDCNGHVDFAFSSFNPNTGVVEMPPTPFFPEVVSCKGNSADTNSDCSGASAQMTYKIPSETNCGKGQNSFKCYAGDAAGNCKLFNVSDGVANRLWCR